MQRIEEVEAGIRSGAIVDPAGVVTDSARGIAQEMQAVMTVMAEIKNLTRTESALYYDQQQVEAVENRIRSQLASMNQPVEVA
jgi:hypothetical protein